MTAINIAATSSTPEVDYNILNEVQRITGVSTPVDSVEFYSPMINWINQNAGSLKSGCVFEFELNYFNSSSMKALVWLLQQIEEMILAGNAWTIRWVIVEDDEFMEEAAEAMQTLLEVPVAIERRS
ncbi:MAG: hypothetical protein RL362_830 [Bacteroidota bacterium]|jgi:hypothetical protein